MCTSVTFISAAIISTFLYTKRKFIQHRYGVDTIMYMFSFLPPFGRALRYIVAPIQTRILLPSAQISFHLEESNGVEHIQHKGYLYISLRYFIKVPTFFCVGWQFHLPNFDVNLRCMLFSIFV